jgi:hypothetical protein
MVPGALAAVDDIEAMAKGYVDELAEKLRGKGFTVSREVSLGYAAESILDVAAKHKVDLIAMSSHGRTGFGRLLMGSVADQVVRRSPRPCLVIRPAAIAQERQRDEPSAAAEVVTGLAAAKIVVPTPTLVEHEVQAAANPSAPQAPKRRPERRALQ